MNREASILAALPNATAAEAGDLVSELNEIRANARRRLAVSRELDLGAAAAAAHLTPAQPFVRHTAATDWLARMDPSRDDAKLHVQAKAEATNWFRSVHAMVRANPEELTIQAEGYATVWASQFDSYHNVVKDSFLQQVDHLAGIKREATRKSASGTTDSKGWSSDSRSPDRATCSCGFSTTSDAAWQDHIFKSPNSNEFKKGHERVSTRKSAAYGDMRPATDDEVELWTNGYRNIPGAVETEDGLMVPDGWDNGDGDVTDDDDFEPIDRMDRFGSVRQSGPSKWTVSLPGRDDVHFSTKENAEKYHETSLDLISASLHTGSEWEAQSCGHCGGNNPAGTDRCNHCGGVISHADAWHPSKKGSMAKSAARSLSDIARDIRRDWKNVNYGAVPYLDAMRDLDSINDKYGADDARMIVAYFLSNATTWRGETAKAIKAELKAMMSSKTASQRTAYVWFEDSSDIERYIQIGCYGSGTSQRIAALMRSLGMTNVQAEFDGTEDQEIDGDGGSTSDDVYYVYGTYPEGADPESFTDTLKAAINSQIEFAFQASVHTADELPKPDDNSQNGYGESGLPMMADPSQAPENSNMGWIGDDDSDVFGPDDEQRITAMRVQAGNPYPVGTPNWFEWESDPDAEGHGPYDSGAPGGGIPLHGPLTAEQQAWMNKGRSKKSNDTYTASKTAGVIKGADEALKSAPREEQVAYWNYVGQMAADSDSAYYVPIDFNSWRSSYWDDSKSAPSYAPGLPPMASSRRQALEGDTTMKPPGAAPQIDEGGLSEPQDNFYEDQWIYDGDLIDTTASLDDTSLFDMPVIRAEGGRRQASPFVREAMPAPADVGISVGDIFVNSWGYDQTNIDFYKVIRLTGAGVEIVPIGKKFVSQNGPGGNRVVPDPNTIRDRDVITGIGVAWDDRADKKSKVCKITSSGNLVLKSGEHWASKWDGQPEYETDSMFGH